MPRLRLMLRLGVIAAWTVVVLVCIGQYAWPEAIARIDVPFINAFRGLDGLGWLGFVLVQVMVAISGFVPASLVGVAAGAAYGVSVGFATASISTLTGAVVAFLLSRSLLRPFIERKLRGVPQLSSLDGHIRQQGWRFVCLLRLSPVMPFAATSYALGLSSITLRQYLAGTLASLPSLLVYVLAGVAVRSGVSAWNGRENSIRIALMVLGTVSMAILIVQVARALRRVRPATDATTSAPAMLDMKADVPEMATRPNRRG
jgi:uncharacterized membrane protein YdjX (TVP38/TMEM64 family)